MYSRSPVYRVTPIAVHQRPGLGEDHTTSRLETPRRKGRCLWYSETSSVAQSLLKKDRTDDSGRSTQSSDTSAILRAQKCGDGSDSFDASLSGQLTELRRVLTQIWRVFGNHTGVCMWLLGRHGLECGLWLKRSRLVMTCIWTPKVAMPCPKHTSYSFANP